MKHYLIILALLLLCPELLAEDRTRSRRFQVPAIKLFGTDQDATKVSFDFPVTFGGELFATKLVETTIEPAIQAPDGIETLEEVPLSHRRIPSSPSVSTATGQDPKIIDLRPPSLREGSTTIIGEPHWVFSYLPNQALLRAGETRKLQFLSRSGTDFGYTTLPFGFYSSTSDSGPLSTDLTFHWHFMSGPSTTPVDPQAFDLIWEWNYAMDLSGGFSLQMNLSPTISSDFARISSKGLRLLGGGLLAFQSDFDKQWVFGATYLDRPDVPVLPIAGLKWEVRDGMELDLIVPKPRFAYRLRSADNHEGWFFTGGEMGGGSWGIERIDYTADRMSYRDLRLLVGMEHRDPQGGQVSTIEVGYVFRRRIEFEKGPGNTRLGDTFAITWSHIF